MEGGRWKGSIVPPGHDSPEAAIFLLQGTGVDGLGNKLRHGGKYPDFLIQLGHLAGQLICRKDAGDLGLVRDSK